jgi:hypothetical protein
MNLLLLLLLLQAPTLKISNMADGGTFRNDTIRLLIDAPGANRMELWLLNAPPVTVTAPIITTTGQPTALYPPGTLFGQRLVATKQAALGNLPSSYVPLEWGERNMPYEKFTLRVVACTAANACVEKILSVTRIR